MVRNYLYLVFGKKLVISILVLEVEGLPSIEKVVMVGRRLPRPFRDYPESFGSSK